MLVLDSFPVLARAVLNSLVPSMLVQALQEAAHVCSAAVRPSVGLALEDGLEVQQTDGRWDFSTSPWKIAMEKYLRVPGKLKGRIELQFLMNQTDDSQPLYAGRTNNAQVACRVDGVGQ